MTEDDPVEHRTAHANRGADHLVDPDRRLPGPPSHIAEHWSGQLRSHN
jgi:hypothetical protein